MSEKRMLVFRKILLLLVSFLLVLNMCVPALAANGQIKPNPKWLPPKEEWWTVKSTGEIRTASSVPIEILIVSRDGEQKQKHIFSGWCDLTTGIEPGDVIYYRYVYDPEGIIRKVTVPQNNFTFDGKYVRGTVPPGTQKAYAVVDVFARSLSVPIKPDANGNYSFSLAGQDVYEIQIEVDSEDMSYVRVWRGVLQNDWLDLQNNTLALNAQQAVFSLQRGSQQFVRRIGPSDFTPLHYHIPFKVQPGDRIVLAMRGDKAEFVVPSMSLTYTGKVLAWKAIGKTSPNVRLRATIKVMQQERYEYLQADQKGNFELGVSSNAIGNIGYLVSTPVKNLVVLADFFKQPSIDADAVRKYFPSDTVKPKTYMSLEDAIRTCSGGPDWQSAVPAGSTIVRVLVNGLEVVFPDVQAYTDKTGHTLVPVRFVAEALGAKVDATPDGAVMIEKGSVKIHFRVGTDCAVVNGIEKAFGTKSVLVKERTMVPLRFISETLGAKVGWNDQTRTVSIDL